MKKKTLRIILGIALALIFILLAFGLGDTLFPLCFAFFLAYLIFPVVTRFEKLGFSRVKILLATSGLLILINAVFIFFVVPPLVSDIRDFSKNLPDITAATLVNAQNLANQLGLQIDLSNEAVKEYFINNSEEIVSNIKTKLGVWSKTLFSGASNWLIGILNLFLIPLFFFYLINDYEKLVEEIKKFVPPNLLSPLQHYMQLSNRVLNGYIRGQIFVALCLALLYSISLTLIGLKFGFLIGLFTGLLSIIPYVGFTLGLISSLIIVFANYTSPTLLILVISVFLVIQLIEGFLITPKLVGDKVGLNALTTMLALIIGGNLLGVTGMILGIPIAAILKSIIFDIREQLVHLNKG